METSTETQIHVYIEGWGRSGCTCERLRDQLRQTVHTGDDDCIDLAQCNAGKGGRRQIVSLSTSQKSVWGDGGVGRKEMRDLVSITVLTEVEGKVSLRDD